MPGRPELLGTTRDFLDYFGLRSLDELPPLSELKAVGDINLQLDLAADAAGGARNEDGAGEPAAASAIDAAGGLQPAAEAHAAADSESGPSAASPAEPPSDEALLEGSAENAGDEDDEHDEGDELSAEGGDSRELVAAPRDSGD